MDGKAKRMITMRVRGNGHHTPFKMHPGIKGGDIFVRVTSYFVMMERASSSGREINIRASFARHCFQMKIFQISDETYSKRQNRI